jgi:hypothetical protein
MPLPVTPRSREQTGPWVQSDIDAMPDWTLGVRPAERLVPRCRPGAHPPLTGSVSDDGWAASW